MAAETRARFPQVQFSAAWSLPWRVEFVQAVHLAFAILVAFLLGRTGLASPPANVGVRAEPLAHIIDWVLAYGSPKTVSAPVAEALDFGTTEIKVKQTGYQSDDKLARVVAVPLDGSGKIILCHLSMDGSGVCWRTDKSGVLKATARLGSSGQAMSVSATLSEREDFETQKTYFGKKASH
jgi:hypothetical protein